MCKWRLLIAGDDLVLRRTLEANFLADGFDVIMAQDGASAVRKAQQRWPDAAILDYKLLDCSGFAVAAQLRQVLTLPIIMLTSVDDEQKMIRELEAHADDYVCKPFRYGELRARLTRLFTRYYDDGCLTDERIVVDEHLSVDLRSGFVWRDGRKLVLTPMEARILFVLLQHANQPVPTATLLRRAWGSDQTDDLSALWVRMRKLRTKIEPDVDQPRYIVTERGVGYRFCRPTSASPVLLNEAQECLT